MHGIEPMNVSTIITIHGAMLLGWLKMRMQETFPCNVNVYHRDTDFSVDIKTTQKGTPALLEEFFLCFFSSLAYSR